MAEEYKSLNEEQKLKLTIYNAVDKTCEETGEQNTLFGSFTVEKEAKELITEFICKKMKIYAEDLEAFANHAKRNHINGDDVKLLFRRNTKLLEKITQLELDKKVPKKKKRKRPIDSAESEDENVKDV